MREQLSIDNVNDAGKSHRCIKKYNRERSLLRGPRRKSSYGKLRATWSPAARTAPNFRATRLETDRILILSRGLSWLYLKSTPSSARSGVLSGVCQGPSLRSKVRFSHSFMHISPNFPRPTASGGSDSGFWLRHLCVVKAPQVIPMNPNQGAWAVSPEQWTRELWALRSGRSILWKSSSKLIFIHTQ